MSKKKSNRGGSRSGNNRGGGYAGKSKGGKLVKVIVVGLFLLAVAYVITSLALGMVWNPLKWGKKPDKPAAGKSPLTVSISEENGISLTTSVESGEPKTVRIEASFTPADATETKVEWSMYAQGLSAVEDYIQMTPDENNAPGVTLTCLKPFGRRIWLSCMSLYNSEISAQVNIDYLKVPLEFWGCKAKYIGSTTENFSFNEIEYDVGTVEPTIKGDVTINFAEGIITALQSAGYTIQNNYKIFNVIPDDRMTARSIIYQAMREADDEFSESNLDSAMSVIGKYLKANDDGCGEYFLFVFKFNGVYEYNGETIGSFENQNDFGLNNLNEFTVYPEDINIGDGVVIV